MEKPTDGSQHIRLQQYNSPNSMILNTITTQMPVRSTDNQPRESDKVTDQFATPSGRDY